jgi:hypothetical protein
MNSVGPIYREVQPYREYPPFALLVGVGTLFGWFLIIYVGVMGRSLGALNLPDWLAWAIGLPFGVLLPLAYTRLSMVTEVYPDRIHVNNGMSGRVDVRLADVTQVEMRQDNILGDYSVRNVGSVAESRTAYTVASTQGVQLTMRDGRLLLIGSKEPEAAAQAMASAWRSNMEEAQSRHEPG